MRVTITKPQRRKAKPRPRMTPIETLAVEGHRTGQSWISFIDEHGAAIRRAEPFNLTKYRKLRAKLFNLLTNGVGRQASRGQGPAQWFVDDAPEQLELFPSEVQR